MGPGWCGLAMLLALVRDVSERLGLVQQVTQRALHQRPKRDEDLEGKGGGDVRGRGEGLTATQLAQPPSLALQTNREGGPRRRLRRLSWSSSALRGRPGARPSAGVGQATRGPPVPVRCRRCTKAGCGASGVYEKCTVTSSRTPGRCAGTRTAGRHARGLGRAIGIVTLVQMKSS